MTNEEEKEWGFFLRQTRLRFSRVTPGGDIAHQLCDLAERLLKENSELRVRDSNVTFHSKNVMGVNEDLQAALAPFARWYDEELAAGAITEKDTDDWRMVGEANGFAMGPTVGDLRKARALVKP